LGSRFESQPSAVRRTARSRLDASTGNATSYSAIGACSLPPAVTASLQSPGLCHRRVRSLPIAFNQRDGLPDLVDRAARTDPRGKRRGMHGRFPTPRCLLSCHGRRSSQTISSRSRPAGYTTAGPSARFTLFREAAARTFKTPGLPPCAGHRCRSQGLRSYSQPSSGLPPRPVARRAMVDLPRNRS
jgi:hypothetical protein